jgi:CubicO group peptidase (beta-lactamase class C family)
MVFAGENADGTPKLEKPDHPMTMRELMTHMGGISYGLTDSYVDRMYREKDYLGGDLQQFIDALAATPILFQPGTRWNYSLSVDVQGYLVEKLSGQSFPEFLRTRIFEPLGMVDTGFYVPAEKWDRFSKLYSYDAKTNSISETDRRMFGEGDYRSPPKFTSGGAGLTSTMADYMRFALMLLNGGSLDGARILSPQSVKMLSANHLPEGLPAEATSGLGRGLGFGLDFAVVEDPVKVGALFGKGTYYWGGAAGTWFWIDPEYDIVVVGMVQSFVTAPRMQDLTRNLIYQALVDPEK